MVQGAVSRYRDGCGQTSGGRSTLHHCYKDKDKTPFVANPLCLQDIFPDLLIEKVLAMHQSGFSTSTTSNRKGALLILVSQGYL